MRTLVAFRTRGLALLVGSLAVPACFAPDRSDELEEPDDDDSDETPAAEGGSEEEEEEQGPVCTDLEETCEVNGDCSCFGGSTDVGNALCLSDGETGLCSSICQQHSDCQTGCCGALEGDVDYGACAPSFVCEGDTGTPSNEDCIDGVAFFCACAAWAGVDCSSAEIEAFAATCQDPSHDLYEVFECWSGFSGGGQNACGDGLDACEI